MSEKFSISGKCIKLFPVQEFSSGFCKREFVIETEDKYPQAIKFEVVKDNISKLDDVREGDDLEVSFNIRGNEHKEKFYVSLTAWMIRGGSGGGRSAPESTGEASQAPEQGEEDDIPF